MAKYTVNRRGVAHARKLIKAKRYVLNSNWGNVQPKAADENTFLKAQRSVDEHNFLTRLVAGV